MISNTKVVIVGSAFRQAKNLINYCENIIKNSPVLKSILDTNKPVRRDVDQWGIKINTSTIIGIPIGDGSTIRGLRANVIICDEFSSIPVEIYEEVISGFAAVSQTPVEDVILNAKKFALEEDGKLTEDKKKSLGGGRSNQSIISGTCGYDFEHFAKYWKDYKNIIESKGNKEKLSKSLVEDNPLSEHLNPEDYTIIRIPYELIPKGFMDDKIIGRAKATYHTAIYLKEFGACFVKDSDGFFKRTLIESCVGTDVSPISLQSGSIFFDATLIGNPNLKYVYGIDPVIGSTGKEGDNFALVILEIREDHARVVYCWTTNQQNFKMRKSSGLTHIDNFYKFCCNKIRELMKVFPCERMGIDVQGGGVAIMEALHDKGDLLTGQQPLWPTIEEKEKETDHEAGLHIIEPIQFARYEWTSEANHGLKKDMESKMLLFPQFDPISLQMAAVSDANRVGQFENENPGQSLTLYDTFEDCVMEIEELKNELTTIIMSRAGSGISGRDKWDTPEARDAKGKKIKLRKDRYSALLIANMLARKIQRTPIPEEYNSIGGFVGSISTSNSDNKLYSGPAWFTENVNQGGMRSV